MSTSVEKQVNGTPKTSPEPRFDPVALAEAEAIRTRAAAEADALRKKAAGEAKAAELLAAEQAEAQRLENEKQALANERAALRFQRERAEQKAKIAEADKKREDIERAREKDRRADEKQQKTEADSAKAVEKASKRWRRVAQGFYALCAAVALPVQMAAFWNPHAKYLLVAPVFIEVIALVALVGAAAAVTAGRPYWHYRLVAWLGALTAASINLWHGMYAFDPATAFGTALASVAGPGMWDLHEHGRIRQRDGRPSWRERRAQRKAKRAETARKAAEEKRRAAEQEAADKAAAEAAEALDKIRREEFPEIHKHALRLAAAWGEPGITPAAWRQAHIDIEGTEPGESAAVITGRRKAEKRVEAARSGAPVNTLSKTTNAQRANQIPRAQRGPARKPPTRQAGDTQQYVAAARRQASITAKQAAKNPRPNDN